MTKTSTSSLVRAAWAFALAVVALLAIALARPAGAQGAGAGRWEYRVFRLDPADYEDKSDWRQILQENRNDPLRAEAAFHEHVLKHLGEERWELVQVDRARANLVYLYLKRPAR